MKNKIVIMFLCCFLVVGMLTGCNGKEAAYGCGKSRSITVFLLNRNVKLDNVRFYDYISKSSKTLNGTYYAVSDVKIGARELTFAGNGKTYAAKANICSDKIVVRYTNAGSVDTYKKK